MNFALYEKYNLDYLNSDSLVTDRFVEKIISYFTIYEIFAYG